MKMFARKGRKVRRKAGVEKEKSDRKEIREREENDPNSIRLKGQRNVTIAGTLN